MYTIHREALAALENDLWQVLHRDAERTGSTVSELVRRAVRERYLGPLEVRREAMTAVIGAWAGKQSDDAAIEDASEVVRRLRKGSRLDRLK